MLHTSSYKRVDRIIDQQTKKGKSIASKYQQGYAGTLRGG